MVDMPSGETPNIEHPSTFGYTQDVGPFDNLEAAKKFLETGLLDTTKATGAMKKRIEINGETYIVEFTKDGRYIISKKNGTPDIEDAILVMQAWKDGKGKTTA